MEINQRVDRISTTVPVIPYPAKTSHPLILYFEVLATIAAVAAVAVAAAVAIASVLSGLPIPSLFAQIVAGLHAGVPTCPRWHGIPDAVTTFIGKPIPARTVRPHAKHHDAVVAHVLSSHFRAILHAIGFAFLLDGGGEGQRDAESDGDQGSHLPELGFCKRENKLKLIEVFYILTFRFWCEKLLPKG